MIVIVVNITITISIYSEVKTPAFGRFDQFHLSLIRCRYEGDVGQLVDVFGDAALRGTYVPREVSQRGTLGVDTRRERRLDAVRERDPQCRKVSFVNGAVEIAVLENHCDPITSSECREPKLNMNRPNVADQTVARLQDSGDCVTTEWNNSKVRKSLNILTGPARSEAAA